MLVVGVAQGGSAWATAPKFHAHGTKSECMPPVANAKLKHVKLLRLDNAMLSVGGNRPVKAQLTEGR
jgi:hypothetical protein